MKRKTALLLLICLLLGLTGCRSTETSTPLDTEPGSSTLSGQTLPSKPNNDALVRVLDYIPELQQALAYATTENFTGHRIYDFTDVYLRYGTVTKLAAVCEELAAQGLGLKIWDGFRPVVAQAKLWEIWPDAAFVSHPVTGSRSHCRGNTVDVTLIALDTGEELPLPTPYDTFSALADRDYSDVPPEAAQNAKLLEETMVKHGFKPYFAEWWHFTDTDDYPIDEYFDPAVPTQWIANCEEFISLRSSVGVSETILKISSGDTVTLLDWSGKYARVFYQGYWGYVMTNYIMPEENSYFTECLDTVAPTNMYAYEQMLADIHTLQIAYPDFVTTEVLGTSELGREIPVLRIGDPNAEYHVLLQGAIHGREHLTAWLLMAMADYWLDHGILSYGNICYHIIPMSNPDGVVISQTETLTEAQQEIYHSDAEQGYTTATESRYAMLWKANGLGVDINRNFSAGWESIDERMEPSSEGYPGTSPFSTAEARALRDYTLRYLFDATISYHATGSLIYYEYGEKQPVNTRSYSLGTAVREISGYPLEGSDSVDGAGYKDWVIDALEIPSLTIEIGCEEAALAEREIYSIFVRNYRILPAVSRWLQSEE